MCKRACYFIYNILSLDFRYISTCCFHIYNALAYQLCMHPLHSLITVLFNFHLIFSFSYLYYFSTVLYPQRIFFTSCLFSYYCNVILFLVLKNAYVIESERQKSLLSFSIIILFNSCFTSGSFLSVSHTFLYFFYHKLSVIFHVSFFLYLDIYFLWWNDQWFFLTDVLERSTDHASCCMISL